MLVRTHAINAEDEERDDEKETKEDPNRLDTSQSGARKDDEGMKGTDIQFVEGCEANDSVHVDTFFALWDRGSRSQPGDS